MQNQFVLKFLDREETFNHKIKLLDLITDSSKKYICAKVNNRLRELTYDVFYDASIEFLTCDDEDAVKIYETSLRYLFVMAVSRIYPEAKVSFSFNISRSIFASFDNLGVLLDSSVLEKIEQEMKDIVNHDYPLNRKIVSNEEAKEIYIKNGYEDKMEILKYRPEKTVHFYECNGYLNYMYGYMVPSTGYLKDYILRLYNPGIIIQYPRSECHGKIPPFEDAPTFGRTLKEAYIWSKKVKAHSVAQINNHVRQDGTIDFINLCESNHNNMLAEIGLKILNNIDDIRIICIAGPSSSGKTTFANRLRMELLSRGINPIRISIDDYYLSKSEIPTDENGDIDLESIEALDIPQFNRNMIDLIQGKEVQLPHFDFKLGHQVPGRIIKVDANQPIIIEGIHALNNRLTSLVPKHQKFKIYISPQAQINLDNHNPISLTDLRLVRRIVRDHKFRGSDAEETISMWPKVRRGEFRWIYKGQEDADYVFNSLLPYELCIMKKYALPLLTNISQDSPYFVTANRLIKFLKYFVDMDDHFVPCNSLIREFIGDSCFQDV